MIRDVQTKCSNYFEAGQKASAQIAKYSDFNALVSVVLGNITLHAVDYLGRMKQAFDDIKDAKYYDFGHDVGTLVKDATN